VLGEDGEVEALGAGVDGEDVGLADGDTVGVELGDPEALGDDVGEVDGALPGSQSRMKPPLDLAVWVQVRPCAAAAARWAALAEDGELITMAPATASNRMKPTRAAASFQRCIVGGSGNR